MLGGFFCLVWAHVSDKFDLVKRLNKKKRFFNLLSYKGRESFAEQQKLHQDSETVLLAKSASTCLQSLPDGDKKHTKAKPAW
jgi:hypothetical protein